MEYEAHDDKREKIGKVRVLRDGEVVREYLPPEPNAEEGIEALGAVHERRTMDCVDCHNRPTHEFDGPREVAVEWAMERKILDPSVPWLRKMAIPALERTDYPRDGVETALRADLVAAYEADEEADTPDAAALDAAAKGLATMYQRNIYPEMKIVWDTYPSHIGHRGENADKRGCFRCHDNKHQTAEGDKLSKSCSLCHSVLVDEEAPEDVPKHFLTLLPKHLVDAAKAKAKAKANEDEDEDEGEDDEDEDEDEDDEEKAKQGDDQKAEEAEEGDDEKAEEAADEKVEPDAGSVEAPAAPKVEQAKEATNATKATEATEATTDEN